MISIENSSSDPSSSSSCLFTDRNRNRNRVPELLISSSNSSNSDEKKASTASAYDNKLALVEEEKEEVDLLKSSVHDCNPPPEFSIRDYVYDLRSKDIRKNWPFSEENLMLCLKHGVRNLLPPFQSLDSLKNPSVNAKSLPENGIVTSSNGEPSRQSRQFVSANSQSSQCNLKLDSGNKVPKCMELRADSLEKVSKKKLEHKVLSVCRKADTASQSSQAKKSKLMVKFSSVDHPVRSNEDIPSNNFMVSETMASKVCPVCKTFTSSSNTTLNAHIDQCLSGESTMKWTANPKVIKNRVKPRKTRLMVDIYKTAPTCTLEELDRRNGTNWATNSNFPAQEIEFHGKERENEQKGLIENGVETGHEGDVYIDSDGTKVRILSVPKIGAGDVNGSRKLLKQKGPKFIAGKKEKKTREEKHHKFLKLSPCSKIFSSPKLRRGFEMRSNQEKNFMVEEDCHEEEDTPEQRFQSEEELELDDDRCFSRALSSSDNPISSPESSEKTDKSPYESQDDDYVDQRLLRKRVGFRSKSYPGNKMAELTGQSKNTDDFVVRSNARKLPSLRKNMLSASRNSMSELRSGVKRKFSTLKKSRSFVGPSHVDRLRNRLQDSGNVSQLAGGSKKNNVMEIRKTRTGIKISGEQALYVQPRNTIEDSLADPESSGKEIETRDERNYLNSEFDYRGPFSEPERPIFSPQASLDDREKMFTEEDNEKTLNGETNSKIAELGYKEMGSGVYFLEVERIPIPGPPGSFLPSPGADMVSEDVQGNSSLTNSRVQSSEDRLELVDRDSMVDSPISATSTISNPTYIRSDSRSSEKLSVKSIAVDENQNPIRHVVGERTEETFSEKGSASDLKNDHQPCCCSRKEGVAQSYQESALLRRRTIEWSNKCSVNSLTMKPGTFTLSNYPPEKAVVPPENIRLTIPDNDTAAASPSSTSNPVLRLMGKDLMVVKKDQDIATTPQLPPPPLSSSFDHSNCHFFTAPAATPASLQNHDYQSLHQVFHTSFDQEQQNVDFRNYVPPQMSHTPIHALERSFTNTTMLSGGYMNSNSYGLSGSHRYIPQAPDRASNSYESQKEIIVIDDSPENEVDLVQKGLMRTNSVHFPTGYNPRQVNSFYNNQSSGSFSYGGTQAIKYASFQRPVSREMINASPHVWSCFPEGSREMNASPTMWNHRNLPEGGISSPATAHLGSTAYYPRSFS